MAQLNFNATGIKPAGISMQLPVSDSKGHLVVIKESDIEENAAKTGGFVKFMLEIIEGPNAGDAGPWRINLFNPSHKAVEIANAQMAALCLVTNVIDVKDSQQLHNIPFRAVVKYQKGEDPATNPEGNGYTEVKGVLHADGAAPGKSAGGPAPTPQIPQNPAPQQQPQSGGWQGGQQQGQQQGQHQQNGGAWGQGQTPQEPQGGQQQQQGWGGPANSGGGPSPTPPWGQPK